MRATYILLLAVLIVVLAVPSSLGHVQPSTNGSSSRSSNVAIRPEVPQPAPDCLAGWSAEPPVGSGKGPQMCYKLFTTQATTGEYGQPAETAEESCERYHPRATLASSFSAQENAWIVNQLFLRDTSLKHILSETAQSRRLSVLIGGRYMQKGLIGSWHGDVHLYNSSAYEQSFPSSPAWPSEENNYYQNWAVATNGTQLGVSYGCVTMSVVGDGSGGVSAALSGQWLGEDCRTPRPYLCSYLNDGSEFPLPTPTPEPSGDSSSSGSGTEGEVSCVEGWALFAGTQTCYRVFHGENGAITAPVEEGEEADIAVSPAKLQDRCQHVIADISTNAADVVKAATIVSTDQSEFVGQLVKQISGGQRALIGASYVEYGHYGLYLDGRTNWMPQLVQVLWARGEPKQEKGCVSIDASGEWHYAPCGTPSSTYVCEYHAKKLNVVPPTSTPAPTVEPPTTQPPASIVPLQERVASLAGAVHLVVASQSVGLYTVDSRGGHVEGLLFFFAPVSPFYTDPLKLTSQAPSFEELLFDTPSGFAPCDGYKKQEEISSVFGGKLTVQHRRGPESGYICVSEDGKTYVQTRLTYEVVASTVRGMIPIANRNIAAPGSGGCASDSDDEDSPSLCRERPIISKWRPPLFYNTEDIRANASLLQRTISIEQYTSGSLQVLQETEPSPTAEGSSTVTHIRLSATADCMSSVYHYLGTDIPLINATAYARPQGANHSTLSDAPLYAVSYQHADVHVLNVSKLQRLSDSQAEVPLEYFVCAAVRKSLNHSASALLWGRDKPTLDNSLSDSVLETFGNASNTVNSSIAQQMAIRRLVGSQSIAADQKTEVRIYTLVPSIKVYLVPPPVSVTGMWALPPRGGAAARMRVESTRLAYSGDHVPLHVTNNSSVAARSATHVVVQQYTSPVLVLDGHGILPGMTALLSQEENMCDREQEVHRDGAGMGTALPSEIDTMLPVSVVTVMSKDGQATTVPFIQLNLNITGMWGTRQDTQYWYLCFSYDTHSSFVPLPLRIQVQRLSVSAATAVSIADADVPSKEKQLTAPEGASTQLSVSVGFAGLIRLWGLDSSMWSAHTLENAQVSFAQALPDSDEDPVTQCESPSLFYAQRSFGLVAPPHMHAEHNATAFSDVVIPTGFLLDSTVQRLRLCLSVPQPFAAARRLFLPVDVTVGIRPIEVMYVGRYSAVPQVHEDAEDDGYTVVKVADESDNVVFPVVGYGLRPDMDFVLSERPCYGQSTSSVARDPYLVARQSKYNVSLTLPYDVPSKYRATALDDTVRSSEGEDTLYMVITKDALTSSSVADGIFGIDRRALYVCLHAPSTREEVFPTRFKLVVQPPRVTAIRNVDADAKIIKTALGSIAEGHEVEAAVVVYSASMDLIIEGFGFGHSSSAEAGPYVVPAVDCSNASTFLWREPLPLSPVPSTTRRGFLSNSSRYVDPQTSMSSWYIPLRPSETVRIGQDGDIPADGVVRRFTWCIRYHAPTDTTDEGANNKASEVMDGAATPTAATGFVSTGIPYNLVIPDVEGFLVGPEVTQRLVLPTQADKVMGDWERIQLVGPLVDVARYYGNPLYLLLSPKNVSCAVTRKQFVQQRDDSSDDDDDELLLVAVNGSSVLTPAMMTTPGKFKLCASTVYPAVDDGAGEAASTMIPSRKARIEFFQPVYGVFSLNHTTTVTVEHGEEWTLPISGSYISNKTAIRFRPLEVSCESDSADGTILEAGLSPIYVRNGFNGITFLGADAVDEEEVEEHYVVLQQELIRALPAHHAYRLCFKPNKASPWSASAVLLKVKEHTRQPTHYVYFADDGSEDVVSVTTLVPTKIAMPHITGESDTANIVGALDREVTLAMWCRADKSSKDESNEAHASSESEDSDDSDSDGSSSSSDSTTDEKSIVSCGTQRRVMFVKPLDDDRDPCFVDAEAVESDIIRGPYVIHNGILTLPSGLGSGAQYPNMTQPWIMCLETGPERWREPIYPLFLIQYTEAVPVAFRMTPDDPSNTSAAFPVTASADDDVSLAADNGGNNSTLTLYAGDSDQVFYLNGYGIRRGMWIRFGAHCEEDEKEATAHSDRSGSGSSSSSSSEDEDALIGLYQELNNSALYTKPLLIEDDHGVFLVPRGHQVEMQKSLVPMCLSTDGGVSYTKTSLHVVVQEPRLSREQPVPQEDLIDGLFSETILVPRLSTGDVNVSDIVTCELPVGAQVIFSPLCTSSVGALPMITVKRANMLTLTKAHTAKATENRLRICVQLPGQHSEENDDDWWAGDDDESDSTESLELRNYQHSGTYFHVLGVSLGSLSTHALDAPQPTNTTSEVADSMQHVVLRRGDEELLLPISFDGQTEANDSAVCDARHRDGSECVREVFLRMLDSPSAIAFFSLAQLRVSTTGSCAAIQGPAQAPSMVVSSAAFKADFKSNTLRIRGIYNDDLRLVVPLQQIPDVVENSVSTLCLSVDGGRHYVSVGAAFVTANWAPSLQLSGGGYEVTAYQGSSETVKVVDTRYSSTTSSHGGGTDSFINASSTVADTFLHEFIADALWTGLIGNDGFIIQRFMYLAPSSTSVREELVFAIDSRWPPQPTGLTHVVNPVHLACLGDAMDYTSQIRRQDNGRTIRVPAACGGLGLLTGSSVRLVQALQGEDAAQSCASEKVYTAFTADLVVTSPGAWSEGVSSTSQEDDSEDHSNYLLLSPDVAYLPDGTYHMCVSRTAGYSEASVMRHEALYAPADTSLIVSENLTITRVAHAPSGVIAAYQGTNAVLPIEGTAVGLRDVPLLIGFAPVLPHGVVSKDTNTRPIVSLRRGCADVARLVDPLTGDSRADVTGTLSLPEDILLTTPWLPAQDGELRIPAQYLRHISEETLYYVCYSTDNGLSFHHTGGDGDRVVTLTIRPPTVIGFALEGFHSYSDEAALHFNASETSPAALRVQRLSSVSSASTMTQQPESVRLSNTTLPYDSSRTLLARAPSYYYGPTNYLVGNGFGQGSGRALPNGTDSARVSARSMPTIAATVAIVRTSRQGQICAGTISSHPTDGVLAMPAFLLNLQTGSVWTYEDGQRYAQFRASSSSETAAAAAMMNPVLHNNSALLADTMRLLAAGEASGSSRKGAIRFEAVLGMAHDTQAAAKRDIGESLLVCLSVDGKHFYSSNALMLPGYDELDQAHVAVPSISTPTARQQLRIERLSVSAPIHAPTPLAHVPSVPLFIRPELFANGTYWARDVSLLTTLVVRPNRTHHATHHRMVPSESLQLSLSADALARLQDAFSALLGMDAVVFVVQLQPSGHVRAPVEEAAIVARDLDDNDSGDVEEQPPLMLPTYALTLSIASDAYEVDVAAKKRALLAAPDILLKCVKLLRHNGTQPQLLQALLQHSAEEEIGAVAVSAVTMNFTYSTGMDLHAAEADTYIASTLLPQFPGSEPTWRRAMLAVPHAVVAAVIVPDAPDNDNAAKVTWWVVPLLLLLPVGLIIGTYFVYKKYFVKKAEDMPSATAGAAAPVAPSSNRATDVVIDGSRRE